jgi:acetyl-CoA/propionyl-CoA carboxylase
MDDPAFIAGDLSTDYLDRFKILDRVESVAKAGAKDNVDAIVAAALLHSVLVRGGNTSSTEHNTNKWKESGRFTRNFSYGI